MVVTKQQENLEANNSRAIEAAVISGKLATSVVPAIAGTPEIARTKVATQEVVSEMHKIS